MLVTKYDCNQLLKVVEESFSPRKQAMLAWVADGATNEEISQHLNFSQKTIEAELTLTFHFRKLFGPKTSKLHQSVRLGSQITENGKN